MDFNDLIQRVWPAVRKRHLFPQLPTPEVIETGDEAASIQMADKVIQLNANRLTALAQVMDIEDATSALLDHGVGHHTVCPWDFETHLKLYAALKPVLLDGALVKQVVEYFSDVVVDTHAVRERESKLPEVYRHAESSEVIDVIRALYQRLWGENLGVEDRDEVDRLARIPYLDASQWGDSLRSFAQVIAPLIKEDGNGQGGMMGDTYQYSAGELAEGMAQFAEQGFYAFREMVRDFADELQDANTMPDMGRGKGTPSDADLLFYMARASAFRLPVQTMPMEKVGGLHPHSHSPWEIGKPVQHIDVWTSFGRVMPGISQMWNWRDGETHGEGDGIPDCVVIVDSSGSMVDPCREISHAVLGAGCAVDAYLRRGKRVAVYNFSDAQAGGKEMLDFSRDRKRVFFALCRYFGGGTALHLPDLEPLLKNHVDIFLITDMQITNLDALMQFLIQKENRITAVHVAQNRDAQRFRQEAATADHICVYAVERTEDIPDIVLSEVKTRFGEWTNGRSGV